MTRHEKDPEDAGADTRRAGEPDPEELRRQGKDPAWPIPGLASHDPEHDSPASDTEAPAP